MNQSLEARNPKKSAVLQLLIAVVGLFVTVFGLVMFNQHLLMSFSLPLRIILTIITQWMLFLVPGILMVLNKEKLFEYALFKK